MVRVMQMSATSDSQHFFVLGTLRIFSISIFKCAIDYC